MKNSGFILKKLYLTDNSSLKAKISFEKGLNVIFGPSEKGKTFIFQCIQYLLGSNTKPKEIPEAKDCSKCFLTIETYENKYHTLERAFSGGNILLYENQKDNLTESRILYIDNASNEKTISDFLLEICNIHQKKVRKNAQGITQKLYFQDFFNYFMINEKEIITDESPIAKITTRENINTKKTFQENRFRFILTGKDDSEIIVPLKKNIIDNKKGKIELLGELIEKLKSQLTEKNDLNEIEAQLKILDDSIKSLNNDYSITKEKFANYENQKNTIYTELLNKEKRQNTLEETLKRSEILERQYNSDIDRLRATIEAGKAIDSFDVLNCPICNSKVSSENIIDIELVSKASIIEIKKIDLLKNELKEASKIFLIEKEQLIDELTKLKINYADIIETMETEYSRQLSELSSKISNYSTSKDELVATKNTIYYLQDLMEQKKAFEEVVKNNKPNKDDSFNKLEVSHVQPISESLFSILKDMRFENLGNSVSFSEEYNDFVIAQKNRKDFGKGYRAVLYGAFIIAIQKQLEKKDYGFGFSILDSPLNPYKPNETEDGKITINLANNFYDYLSKNFTKSQVIVIENTEVPDNIKKGIKYTKYTKDTGFIQ